MEGKEKIKEGYNLYLYYWIIPFFIGFIAINYFANIFRIETFDLDIMVSVVTFLFGFFISISFSIVLSRTGNIRDSLAQETGRLISLYLLSKQLGHKFNERIRDIIDRYTVKTLRDYKKYELSRQEVIDFYDACDLMETKSDSQKQAAASFLYILGEFEPIREKLEYLTKVKLLRAMKITNYSLAIFLIFSLFLNRGNFLSNALFVVLSTAVVYILLIIEDYENMKLGDYTYNISNSEQIFDLLGKDRYYPKNILGRVKLEAGRRYRIGVYDAKNKSERVFSIKYFPGTNILNKLVKRVLQLEKTSLS